jgi:hypothetical protein
VNTTVNETLEYPFPPRRHGLSVCDRVAEIGLVHSPLLRTDFPLLLPKAHQWSAFSFHQPLCPSVLTPNRNRGRPDPS